MFSDPQVCGSYKRSKSLEHDMKVAVRVLKHRIR